MRSALARVLDFVYPPRCSACDAHGEAPFCPTCAETLAPAPLGCPCCGEPAEDELLALLRPRRCGRCRERAPPFEDARAPYLLGAALADALHRLKYEGREELAAPLGVLFATCEPPRADVVVPIPLHRRRRLARGYDQAVLLGAQAAKRYGLPLKKWLVRTRDTGQQVGRGRLSRERSLAGAFAARVELAGQRICLVDDVLTTGATAAAAARALLSAGAGRVVVRTIARTP